MPAVVDRSTSHILKLNKKDEFVILNTDLDDITSLDVQSKKSSKNITSYSLFEKTSQKSNNARTLRPSGISPLKRPNTKKDTSFLDVKSGVSDSSPYK